jgi:hypothetical protein
MGERFTELHGIHQRFAVSVLPVEFVQPFAPDHEHRYPTTLSRLYLDAAQIAAIAQKERTAEDICCLNAVSCHVFTSFLFGLIL